MEYKIIKSIIVTSIICIFHGYCFSKETLPTIKELCNSVKLEIKSLELIKKNLKKEFKQKNTELEQFELLPDFTEDINKTINLQIPQAKLYHYLNCSRFEK